MLTSTTVNSTRTTILPSAAEESVAQLVEDAPHVALRAAWKALRSPTVNGVAWHRTPQSPLKEISTALTQVAECLCEGEVWISQADKSSITKQIRELVVRSGIPYALESLGERALDVISTELGEMYSSACRMTRCNTGAISIRIEKSEAVQQRFHRDIGTSFFTSLVGPGALFTTSGNVPPTEQGALHLSQLQTPDKVFTTPTASTLIARGISPYSTGEFKPDGRRQGLWHASSGAGYLWSSDWPVRVLLIVATPSHKIAPVTPSLTGW